MKHPYGIRAALRSPGVMSRVRPAPSAIGARRSIAIHLPDATATALDLKPAFPGLAP